MRYLLSEGHPDDIRTDQIRAVHAVQERQCPAWIATAQAWATTVKWTSTG